MTRYREWWKRLPGLMIELHWMAASLALALGLIWTVPDFVPQPMLAFAIFVIWLVITRLVMELAEAVDDGP